MQKEAVVQDRLVQHEREYSMLFYTCNFIATKIEAQALEEKRSVCILRFLQLCLQSTFSDVRGFFLNLLL